MEVIIIPQPQSLELHKGELFAESFDISAIEPEIKDYFKTFPGSDEGVSLRLLKNPGLGEEEYGITINGEGICVYYSTPCGAFRACSTLRQIFEQRKNGFLPYLSISDYPALKKRGYMLDISRGKLPKLEYLKKLADTLAQLKYNEFHLYIDTFVFAFKSFEKYYAGRTVLTAEDIKELDRYCAERFIALVPNINSFGHMAAWTKKKELAPLAITGKDGKPSGTLNPFKPESIELIDKMYDGFMEAFSSETAHIGMDEPNELGLNETEEICKQIGVGRVYTDYLAKICTLLTDKYGKRPMFWDDIVFKHPEELERIPKNAIVMEWGYEAEQHFDRNCRRLKEQGLDFYVCPGSSMWGSFCGRSNNAVFNISDAAETGAYYGAMGFLLTEWGDGGNPQFPAAACLPMIFGAAVSWKPVNHNHELAYAERTELLEGCKKYADRVIFCAVGNSSPADIAFRMGNYYLLESNLHFNHTRLMHCTRDNSEMTDGDLRGFKRVIPYMKDILAELEAAVGEETSLAELKLNCRMVILHAEKLCGYEIDNESKTELKKEFLRLWNMKNAPEDSEMYIEFFDKAMAE